MATGRPAPLLFGEAEAGQGSYAVDTDGRESDAATAAQRTAVAVRRALQQTSSGGCALVYKKIDSTLRGHIASELEALLAEPGLFDAAVVCPALPEQGRTLRGGVLHVRGEPLKDLRELLRTADERVAFIDAGGALPDDARLLAVDAEDEADLDRLAASLLRSERRLLAVGSAGLAKALARRIFEARAAERDLPQANSGPVVGVIGSFSPVAASQLDEIARDGRTAVIRLAPDAWLDAARAAEAVEQARRHSREGRPVVLTTQGSPAPGSSSRALVQAMAAGAEPLLRTASTLLLTGGDTARAVLDRLHIDQLQVLGELEPGICLSRPARAESPRIVTKAGAFGDAGALLRVIRRFDIPLIREQEGSA
jgi:4-hydroxythreonine-4-phosphate dehydrogenase